MNYTRIFFYVFIILFLNSCGGGGGNSGGGSSGGGTSSSMITEIFEDSFVSGIKYSYYKTNDADITIGSTTASGKFTYSRGKSVTFQIGNAIIGTSSSSSLSGYKFPQDLAGVSLQDTNNSKVLNIAILLQSLDKDSNPSNGIDINSSIKSCINTTLLSNENIQDMNNTRLTSIITGCGAVAVDWETARNHLDNTMQSHNITPLLKTKPIITSVTPPSDDTYTMGDALNITLNINEIVDVNTTNGTPYLTLTIGNIDKNATYISGSGTKALNFKYTTENNLEDTNGIALNSLVFLDGGIIQDINDNNMTLSFTPPDLTEVKVDSINPTITGIVLTGSPATNASSITFRATFSESVLDINTSDFNTTVTNSANGIISDVSTTSGSSVDITVSSISGDGTLKVNLVSSHGLTDNAGNNLAGSFDGNDTHTLDLVAPAINSITIPTGTYTENQDINFTLDINESVNVTGVPRLQLDINGTKYAIYQSGTGSATLLFQYTVPANVEDYSISSTSNTLDLNGGSIQDTATNDLNTTLNNFGSLGSVNADSKPPNLTSNDTIPSICENDPNLNFADITATDGSSITYILNDDLNGSLFKLNGQTLTLKNPLNFEDGSIYNVNITLRDNVNNDVNKTIELTILDKDDESNLYLKYVVYDNNLTENNTSDDTAYIYFSKKIVTDDLNTADTGQDYNISNAGNLDGVQSSHNMDLFFSQKVYDIRNIGGRIAFDVNGTATDTNLSIAFEQIRDWDDNHDECKLYPTDYNQTVATKIEYVLKTEQNDGGYENDGNKNTNLFEDKKYSSGVTRNYSRNDVNGTVTDHITQLMWEDDTNTTKDFNDAITYCNDLNLSSYSNWRLTSIKELSTLISYNRLDSNWISDTFKNHKNKKYWSSTSNDASPSNGWYINFDNNTSDSGGEITHIIKSEFISVRCIRNVK